MLSWIYSTKIFTFLFKSIQTVSDFKGKHRTSYFLSLFYKLLQVSETMLEYWKDFLKCGQQKVLTNVQFKIETWRKCLYGRYINFLTTECIRGSDYVIAAKVVHLPAQHKECLSMSWNADPSFFKIVIIRSYISIRATTQQPLAPIHQAFTGQRPIHKTASGGIWVSPKPILQYAVLASPASVSATAHTFPVAQRAWASLGRKTWVLPCLSEMLKISGSPHWFQVWISPHFLHWRQRPWPFSLNEQILLRNERMSLRWQSLKNFTNGFRVWFSLWQLQTADSRYKATWKDQLADPVVLKISHMSLIYQRSLRWLPPKDSYQVKLL